MKIKKSFFRAFISVLLIISLFTSLPITAFAAGDNDVYALTYLVGAFNISDENDGNISSTINGTKYYYSDDYGKYDDISENFSSMENQNVLYELHNSKIARVYSMDNVLVPTITVEPDVKEGLIYRNGKFSQSSFDLSIKLSIQPKSVFQENELFWFLSSDEEKDCLYITLKKLEVEPSGGMDFGSSGWWLWKDYQTKISENLNDNVKVNETKEYHYTVNLQNDKVLNQKEYNIELYTTPTFDFGTGERTTSKIKVGNLDYQEEKTEEKKTASTSGKSVTQASTKLEGVKSALQFSKNLLSSEQTNQINEYVNLWLSELILARHVDKSDIKQKVSKKIANEWLSKLGLDTSVLLVPGTIQATTYFKTQTKDGTKVFIELYINLTSFDFGNSGMPTMATGSGTATIYNMDGEKLDSSVILPAYADVCAFCEQLQKVAKDTIFNGAKQYRTIFGIDTDATAEALSSQIMAKLLNNKYTKDVFKKVDAKDVKTALKKLISEGDKKCGNKIFELVTTPSQNSTLVSVKCPVDVTVFDNDGNICGMVRNNVVDTLYSDVFINVVGDQKNIYLIGDDYTFTLSGTDSGKMDYVVTEFDESGNKSREITYSNIELSDGCNYYSYVPEAENHNSSLFDLTDSDGNIIAATTGMDFDFDVTINGTCGDNLFWVLSDDGLLYIYGSGDMYDYSSSSSVPWYSNRNNINSVVIAQNLTSIGKYAFYYCTNLTSITIPDSVTSIGDYAFRYCTSLASITIPDSVTYIGDRSFEDCKSLTSLTIPDNVTSIGDYAFRYCTSLETVNYNAVSALSRTMFSDPFSGCTTLTTINIGKSVELIPGAAFAYCTSLESITIPNNVTCIGTCAFNNCTSLESVTIPNSVTSIGSSSFYNCTSLKTAGPMGGKYNIEFGWKNEIPSYAFSNCTSLESITIPDSVTSIGKCAFYNCTSLIRATIGKNVTSMGDNAFENCTSLETLNFNAVNCSDFSDSSNLFSGCTALTTLNIGENVEVIPAYTFYNCTTLTNITILDSVTSIGYFAFSHCTNLTSITIPDSVTSIGNSTFSYCTSLASVIIPDSVTSIGIRTFYNCTSLENITIPDSVTRIGNGAFKSCTSLESITIPDSVTSIGDGAFKSCTSLESITIPNSITSIGGVVHSGNEAFSDCKNLMTVTIPGELEIMSNSVFYNCKIKEVIISDGSKRVKDQGVYEYAEKITIPDSVISIDGDAFDDSVWYNNQPDGVVYAGKFAYDYKGEMPENTSITLKVGTKGIADSAFSRCTNLTSIIIPDSVTSIGYEAFSSCESLKSITIPGSVTEIGGHAFENCTSLESITIPGSVTEIGGHAFENCTSLASVTIPNSVKYIDESAFEYCTSLKVVYYSGSKKAWNEISIGPCNSNLENATIHFNSVGPLPEETIVDENTGISVTTNSAAEFNVENLTDSDSAKNVISLLDKNENLVDLYDISLTKDGVAIQPDEPATLKIPTDNENAKVYRIEDNGTVTDMNAVYDNGYMVFTTDHFSLYALVVPNDIVIGDVNGDGEVNAKDRMTLTRYLAKWSGYENIDITAADVNSDNAVNAKDRMILTRHLAKWQGYETLPIN